MQILSALEQRERECTKKETMKITILNLNYRDISNIGYIPDRLRFIEELYLNHNSIEKLSGIEQFPCLRILSVKFNVINSISQFLLIINRKALTSLNFIGNPIEKDAYCEKELLIETFPNLVELNDKSISTAELRPIEIAPLSARYTNSIPTSSVTDSIGSTSSTSQSQAAVTSRRLTEDKLNRITNKENFDGKATLRSAPKTMQTQDSSTSYMLTDYDRYDSRIMFDNQKTATFAQVKALANKHVLTEPNEDEIEPIPTERVYNASRFPFIVDQSQINEQPSFQAKSVDISLLQNALLRNSMISRVNTTGKKEIPKINVSYIDCGRSQVTSFYDLNQSESQITNVFDKHIFNIDKDIDDLARTFYEKSLKEKALQALKFICTRSDSYDETDEENMCRAIQFRNNIRLIRVFYAWVFHMNTNRRKVALIQAMSETKSARQLGSFSSRTLSSESSQTQQESSRDQKGVTNLESARTQKTRRYNYCLTQDFE